MNLPSIGLGTWPLDDGEVETAVAAALELGYRMIDTAHAYGNETGVGRGVLASGVAREDVFLVSKLNAEWHSRPDEAFATSARKLGVDYLDLFLIHWPNPWLDRYVEAWEGLIALREAGRVRAIGMSNFTPAHLERVIVATGVVPDVNQIEVHPALTREGPRAFHAAHGIATQAWAPLGRTGELLSAPVITEVAERHGRTPAQIILRWHVELGLAPLPKSSNRARLRENLDVFDFSLEPAEVAAISALDRGETAATHDPNEFGH